MAKDGELKYSKIDLQDKNKKIEEVETAVDIFANLLEKLKISPDQFMLIFHALTSRLIQPEEKFINKKDILMLETRLNADNMKLFVRTYFELIRD